MTTVMKEFLVNVGELRCAVGLLLIRAENIGTVAEVAARCSANIVDLRDFARLRMSGSRYVGFKPNTLFAIIRDIQNSGEPRKWIVTNFDLAISRLKLADRVNFWSALLSQVTPNSKSTVIIAMPNEETAGHLLPSTETLKEWLQTGRALHMSPTLT